MIKLIVWTNVEVGSNGADGLNVLGTKPELCFRSDVRSGNRVFNSSLDRLPISDFLKTPERICDTDSFRRPEAGGFAEFSSAALAAGAADGAGEWEG
jgi:hypothetical protein